MIEKNVTLSGKRKTSVAKATIKKGSGEIKINKKPYTHLSFFNKLALEEPIEITKKVLGNFDFDINIVVKGGGRESQVAASRLAIGKSLIKFTGSEKLKRELLNYDKGLVVADTRRKESYKPGDSKARRKRQKSFR